MLMDC